MVTKDKPNKVTAVLKVVITGEFYDDEASEETLRYCVEQDLEDVGFDVNVELLKEQEAKTAITNPEKYGDYLRHCPSCETVLPISSQYGKAKFCHLCGKAVKWE